MTAKTPLTDLEFPAGQFIDGKDAVKFARDLERQLSAQIAATKSVLEMNEALCKERDALRDRLAEFEQEPIVGWIVHSTEDLSTAAMYPLSEKDKAFDAAKRWEASITALSLHPNTPKLAARKQGASDGIRD